jgi:hypothetical protein
MMSNSVKPITPRQVIDSKEISIPDFVFEAFNELIQKYHTNGASRFSAVQVEALIREKMIGLRLAYNPDWLNVDTHYQKAGWYVYRDVSSQYNESGVSFRFIAGKK